MKRPILRFLASIAFLTISLGWDDPSSTRLALDRISADSLKGHLSFLASDLLQGRDTPSPGLDLAAEYIAAQFRRAGLEPVGDDGYFQTSTWNLRSTKPEGFSLEIRAGDAITRVPVEAIRLDDPGPIELVNLPSFKVEKGASLADLTAEQVAGKAVFVEIPAAAGTDQGRRSPSVLARLSITSKLSQLGASLVVFIDRDPNGGTGLPSGRVSSPESAGNPGGAPPRSSGPPRLTIHDPRILALYDGSAAGPIESMVTLRVAEPVSREVKLKNVIGLLRGSDPELSKTYVMVTAHYDHIGVGPAENGDKIRNGANDDGSGTVSVVEIANALGSIPIADRPRRSIVFCTFFGEEKGLLGSRHYGRHPIFPVASTVADVNLEQIGRTDDTEGPQVNRASMTGFDFSDLGPIFQAAGKLEGVDVFKHPRNSDAFFPRSDNQALADLGVPAHTICVAYVYPDYHAVGDHWEKVDYANMARIDRMVARGLLSIANDPKSPAWNAENPKAARYREAWKKGHP